MAKVRKRVLVLAAALAVAFVELGAFAGVALVGARIRPRLVWHPDADAFAAEYGEFLAVRHPVLGWPRADDPRFDSTGARPSPAFPSSVPSCVALFGDSFTFAAEVGDEAAWGNLLSRRMNCRVANYGVGGYGTDQAYLRFLDRVDDDAPFVVLGIFEDNVQRNVNQFRELLAGPPTYTFKPRFAPDGGGDLRLVPLAPPSVGDARAFIQTPGRFLTDEYFLPGSEAGPVRPAFPYTVSALRLLLHPDVRAVLSGRPYWARYYDATHDSRALEVTVAIVEAFQRGTASSDRRLLVVLFPSPRTMEQLKPGNTPAYQPLIDRLRAATIEVLDVSHGLLDRLDGRSPCELATDRDACRGHFNEEGNAFVAEIVHAALTPRRPADTR